MKDNSDLGRSWALETWHREGLARAGCTWEGLQPSPQSNQCPPHSARQQEPRDCRLPQAQGIVDDLN